MAQVPEGWGSVYCSTWWGDYRNIQHSLEYKPDCVLPSVVQNYIDRVEAAGGIVEGKECLANDMIGLGYDTYNDETSVILQDYVDRVDAASGITEGTKCLADTIYNLKNT